MYHCKQLNIGNFVLFILNINFYLIIVSFTSFAFANTPNQLNNTESIFGKQPQPLLATTVSSLITPNPQSLKDINSPKTIMQYRAGGHIMGFSSDRVYVAGMGYALIEEFIGANKIQPLSDQKTQQNSPDQKVPNLSKVNYPDLWNGISLRYEGRSNGIAESFWELAAGVKADAIRIKYNIDFSLEENGRLRLKHPNGQGWFSLSAPVAWQIIKGEKIAVKVAFLQVDKQTLGYQLNNVNPDYAVTIDPVLQWNTFQGSVNSDVGTSIALDSAGNIYVTGSSATTWGAPVNSFSGNLDIVVLKLNNNGVLQWNTFYGAANADIGLSLALDATGNIYVTGQSSATWGAPVNAYTGGSGDIAVFKLNNNGVLQWNTFQGSVNSDEGTSLVLDSAGNIYVSGSSYATWGAPVNAFAGGQDIVVFKLNNNGILQWNTFHGSAAGNDRGSSIALDVIGNIYLTGISVGAWGAPVNAYAGSNDIVIFKLNNNGVLQWNTFHGSANNDIVRSLALDPASNIYVTGRSSATWGIPINAHSGGDDIVVLELNNNGILKQNTFHGSAGNDDSSTSLALDSTGNVYITGYSDATWGTPINAYTGNADIVVLKLSAFESLVQQIPVFSIPALIFSIFALAYIGRRRIRGVL